MLRPVFLIASVLTLFACASCDDGRGTWWFPPTEGPLSQELLDAVGAPDGVLPLCLTHTSIGGVSIARSDSCTQGGFSVNVRTDRKVERLLFATDGWLHPEEPPHLVDGHLADFFYSFETIPHEVLFFVKFADDPQIYFQPVPFPM